MRHSVARQANDLASPDALAAEIMLTAAGRTVHDLIDNLRSFMRAVVPRV